MIKERVMTIVNGKGGISMNSIPVYADHNAPFGDKPIGANGEPLMFENGLNLVVVDPNTVTQDEAGKFMTFKSNGEVNYIRCWIYDPETGHGVEYSAKYQTWVEFTHLTDYIPPLTQPTISHLDLDIVDGKWVISNQF